MKKLGLFEVHIPNAGQRVQVVEHHYCKHSQFRRERGNANWVSIGGEFQILSKTIPKQFLIWTKIIINWWVFKHRLVDVKYLCQICRRDWKTFSLNLALEFFTFHNCIGIKFFYQILISFIQIKEKIIPILVSKPLGISVSWSHRVIITNT